MAKFKIHDVVVDMPYEPYESQKQAMEKIISCLSEGSTGLIESPTGTGKSLSIICSVLAYKEHLRRNTIQDSSTVKKSLVEDNKSKVIGQGRVDNTGHGNVSVTVQDSSNTGQDNVSVTEQDKKTNTELANSSTHTEVNNNTNQCNSTISKCNLSVDEKDKSVQTCNTQNNSTKSAEQNKVNDKNFKIIICSRTHKQLDQLVKQLAQTKYRPRMSILASRSQYCINPKLQGLSDKNEACKRLVKNNDCNYFIGKDRLSKTIGQKLFDIEEIVKEGKKCRGCPYFAARKLNDDADLIFAPYNYLIDMKVRENTNIDLSSCVVIIDEAHNIDDVCRSSGSVELTSKIIDIIINELLNVSRSTAFLKNVRTDCMNILDMFMKLKQHSGKVQKFDKKTRNCQMLIKKGNGIKDEIQNIGITKEYMTTYKNSIYSLNKDEDAKGLINFNTWSVIESIDQILSVILFSNCEVYSYAFVKNDIPIQGITYSYNLWLMDGAFIFGPFVRQVRSLVLLSGTLSPFVSFSSELGHKFIHQLTAPHLIKEDQVFISCLKKGHLKQELTGTYKISDSLTYLDQVAKIIYDITNKVQKHGGTLVFVPSYTFLDNLHKRVKLLNLENLLLEPKSGGQREFESVLVKYHNRIALNKPVALICVYRGKAAEGMDFKDSSARAVICVGIPYPSLVDPQIELKKEYNDKHKHFNGRRWYETQAFRAVNQAAGRAIRHKADWGVIFMLDSRYQDKRISSQLSTWVNQFLKVYDDYDSCLSKLTTFLATKK